ncbi:hypothetical protein [Alteraurantiacibacter aquimixticola]|uniref:TonB C-terminal domain-containing protein n=1 Tax=Alteraurantiacibacter aquimixticola TaxID=2489173 RepID=A0A4T3F7U8_9SPHN|nr:hypothetical protein [Alteraurantiacibacter aquimixticola]TIX51070.1 hypothetical protein E5222_00870 [Alteraurantiacibacter aquimixticola]
MVARKLALQRWIVSIAGLASLVFLAGTAKAQEEETLPETEFWLPLSAELREQGAHGELIVVAQLAPERDVFDVLVEQSTGSVVLDEYAVAKLEENGLPETHTVNGEIRARLKIHLYSFTLSIPVGTEYTCEQAVRDYDWYHSLELASGPWRNPLISFYGGAAIVTDREEVQFFKDREKRAVAIETAIAVCRQKPESVFLRELILAGNAQ